ncbi:MAG TPA: sigma-70 family RNA polymerase sigma factor [Verrucomicrobiae bacterium]|jgi:RNA polymerase sigma-70 factor (ECF subfamily)|nr:sigma-70 family RNA polymerase sigma factor [Verrucomicrobiae bacterium]
MTLERDPFLPTRESLLVRLKNWEDQESWRDFFNAYWKLIYAAASSAGLKDSEAQDVVQDTVIAVAKKMKDFRYVPGVDSFKGWLIYLTRKRIALEYRRRERMKGPVEARAEQLDWMIEAENLPDPAGLDLETLWDQEWERSLWEAAVTKVKTEVSLKQFQMFDLYAVKERSATEVADELGVPVAQVYLAKHRVSALLKKELTRLKAAVTQ